MLPQGWMKGNVDRALNPVHGTWGCGVFLRGHYGTFIVGSSAWMENVDDLLMELLACKWATVLVTKMGVRLVLETNWIRVGTKLQQLKWKGSVALLWWTSRRRCEKLKLASRAWTISYTSLVPNKIKRREKTRKIKHKQHKKFKVNKNKHLHEFNGYIDAWNEYLQHLSSQHTSLRMTKISTTTSLTILS